MVTAADQEEGGEVGVGAKVAAVPGRINIVEVLLRGATQKGGPSIIQKVC